MNATLRPHGTPSACVRRLQRVGWLLGLVSSPVAADEWYVNASVVECLTGTGAPATPFCTIGEAIAAAGPGDTIFIAPGDYPEVLRIDKDLDLVGTGGTSAPRIFAVQLPEDAVSIEEGANVAIVGLQIFGSLGSGIRIAEAQPPTELVLEGSTLRANYDGAVHNTNGRVTITDSTLTNNLAVRGGGIYNRSGVVRVESSTLIRNRSLGNPTAEGGGIHSSGRITVEDSWLQDNFAYCVNRTFGRSRGGALYNGPGGIAVLRNTTLSGNYSGVYTYLFGGYGATGGTVMNEGDLLVENCLLTDSLCYPSYYDDARVIDSRIGTLVIEGSTVAGTYRSFDSPTAVRASAGSVLSNSIVWGDPNPFFPGSQVQGSAGLPTVHHCDVQGGWEGPGTSNLAVAPGFTDPDGEDFTLTGASPLIDRGDPASSRLGLDLAGGSRLNDGDLDRVLVLDIGAYEFSHVALAVSGAAMPGGALTLEVTGSAGLDLLLTIGAPEPTGAGLRRDPLGILFFDLSSPVQVVSFGTIPRTAQLTIPPTVVGPVEVVLQLLALGGSAGGKRAANVSNPVFLTVR